MRFDDIDFMWNGGETRRYHGFRMLMEDTVGHHSYNVACIIMKVRPEASAGLLRAALKHDIAEHKAGDMPAPTKRALPDYLMLPDPWRRDTPRTFRDVFGEYETQLMEAAGVYEERLSSEEAWVLKFADSLDGMRFCIQERLLGNKTPRLIRCYETFQRYVTFLLFGDEDMQPLDINFAKPIEPAQAGDKLLYMELRSRWHDANSK